MATTTTMASITTTVASSVAHTNLVTQSVQSATEAFMTGLASTLEQSIQTTVHSQTPTVTMQPSAAMPSTTSPAVVMAPGTSSSIIPSPQLPITTMGNIIMEHATSSTHPFFQPEQESCQFFAPAGMVGLAANTFSWAYQHQPCKVVVA